MASRLLRCPWCPRHVIAAARPGSGVDELEAARDAFRRLADHAARAHRRSAQQLHAAMVEAGLLDG